jgi:hypothetical protein
MSIVNASTAELIAYLGCKCVGHMGTKLYANPVLLLPAGNQFIQSTLELPRRGGSYAAECHFRIR